jgi:hypothetical protein
VRRTDPHQNEGDAAAAAIADFYGPSRAFLPGHIVIVRQPFTDRHVRATVQHCYGHVVLVITEQGESLEYDIDEVQKF